MGFNSGFKGLNIFGVHLFDHRSDIILCSVFNLPT